jgi:hypothetical protein
LVVAYGTLFNILNGFPKDFPCVALDVVITNRCFVALPIIVHRYESRVTIINVEYRYFRLYGECKNNNNKNKSGLVFSVAALAIQTAERLCMYSMCTVNSVCK